jgi:hypothetical protein
VFFPCFSCGRSYGSRAHRCFLCLTAHAFSPRSAHRQLLDAVVVSLESPPSDLTETTRTQHNATSSRRSKTPKASLRSNAQTTTHTDTDQMAAMQVEHCFHCAHHTMVRRRRPAFSPFFTRTSILKNIFLYYPRLFVLYYESIIHVKYINK